MDKHDIDVKNLNPDVYVKVAQIIKALHDPMTGFRGLKNTIFKRLSTELSNELPHDKVKELKIKFDNNSPSFQNDLVLNKIAEFERKYPGPELTEAQREEFESAVYNEVKNYFMNQDEYINAHEEDIKNINDRRFKLKPETIMKYRYFTSCANAADAFVYMNQKLGGANPLIPREDIKYLHSTQWNHLIDGRKGHTVPMIKISQEPERWVALDPQLNDVKFITSKLGPGEKIYHLLDAFKGQPCMITKITDVGYDNHDTFIKEASKVPANKAREFLETISDDVDAGELNEYKEKISQAYHEQMKRATADIKQLGQNTENQSLKSLVYANKKQND